MPRARTSLPEIAGLPAGLAVLAAGRRRAGPGRAPPPFAPIELPRHRRAERDHEPKYCVYRAPGDGVWVDAGCAVEAIGKSGIARPYLVRRGGDAGTVPAAVIGAGRLAPADEAPA